MSETKLRLGRFVREMRLHTGITVTGLAQIAGTNKRVIKDLEKGRGWHTKEKLLHILLAVVIQKEDRRQGFDLINRLCQRQKRKR